MNTKKMLSTYVSALLNAVFVTQLIILPIRDAHAVEMMEYITIYGTSTGSLFVEVYYNPGGGMPTRVNVQNSPSRGGSVGSQSPYYMTVEEEKRFYQLIYDKTPWTDEQKDSFQAQLAVFIDSYNKLSDAEYLSPAMVSKLTKAVGEANRVYSLLNDTREVSSYLINREYAESVAAIAAVAVGSAGVALGVVGVGVVGGVIGLLAGAAIAAGGVLLSQRVKDYLSGALKGANFYRWVEDIGRRLDVPSWQEAEMSFIEHVCKLYPGFKWPSIPGCDGGIVIPPVFFDLEGKGLKIIPLKESLVEFDVDLDGRKELMPWLAPTSPVLFIDVNGSGTLDDAREFMFAKYSVFKNATDLDGLKMLDLNGDEIIDLNDHIYKYLFLWSDDNMNGVSEPDEVRSLAHYGFYFELNGEDVNEDYGDIRVDKTFKIMNIYDEVVATGWSVTLFGVKKDDTF